MNLKTIAKHAAAVVATILAVLVLWQISVAVTVLLSALALGACMYPLVEHLQQRGWPRLAAIALAVCGSLLLVVGFCMALAVPIAVDLQEMVSDVTTTAEELSTRYPDNWLVQRMQATSPDEAAGEEEGTAAPPWMTAIMQSLHSLVGTATDLTQLGANIAITVALSVYWTIDRQRFERLWLSLVPVKRRAATQKMVGSVEREVGAYLRNELAQALLATMLLWAGFEVLGLRYAALCALVAGVLQILPWLGNFMALGAVMVLSSGKWLDLANPWLPINSWGAILYLVVVLLFLEFVIEPRLFNRDRYNSFWTALVTIAMTFTFGVWGLLFGPAVGYSLQIALRQIHPLLFYEPARTTSFDMVGEQLAGMRLRYQVEEASPEIMSFVDRLEAVVQTRATAAS